MHKLHKLFQQRNSKIRATTKFMCAVNYFPACHTSRKNKTPDATNTDGKFSKSSPENHNAMIATIESLCRHILTVDFLSLYPCMGTEAFVLTMQTFEYTLPRI